MAPDWLGHGDSAKPSTSAFDYSQESYIKALDDFVNALDVKKPVALIVHVRRRIMPHGILEFCQTCFQMHTTLQMDVLACTPLLIATAYVL